MKIKVIILFFLFLIYFIFSLHYYYTQRRLFDPFLQIPLSRFDNALNNKEEGKTFRILALGGSTTNNTHLPYEQRYLNILQKILNDKYPEIEIEVFNGSMDWYTSKHSLISYVTYYRDWKPDLVIVMHGINDLYRSFSPPDFAVGDYDELWTHFYGPSITGAKPPTFEQHLLRRFRSIIRRYNRVVAKPVNYPVDKYVSINMFESNLRKLAEFIKYDDVKVAFVSQPYLYKHKMDKEEENVWFLGKIFCYARKNIIFRIYPSASSLSNAMREFNRILEKVALSEEIMFIDVADRIPRNLDNFVDDVHYTEQAAELLAELVAESIVKSNVVEEK